jgi:hypothetical protein
MVGNRTGNEIRDFDFPKSKFFQVSKISKSWTLESPCPGLQPFRFSSYTNFATFFFQPQNQLAFAERDFDFPKSKFFKIMDFGKSMSRAAILPIWQ